MFLLYYEIYVIILSVSRIVCLDKKVDSQELSIKTLSKEFPEHTKKDNLCPTFKSCALPAPTRYKIVLPASHLTLYQSGVPSSVIIMPTLPAPPSCSTAHGKR